MRLSEIAMMFGFTVKQFADVCGCSEQTVYHNGLKNPGKVKAAVHNLKALNDRMYQIEIAEAMRRYELRGRAVDDLEQRITKAGVNADDHD